MLIYFGRGCADYLTCKPLICTDLECYHSSLGIGSVDTLESKFWFLSLYYCGGIFDVKNPKNPFRHWKMEM
ncbi:MAG: hypothetical protein QXR27_00980 [Archaeoglobaceae archaeon]